MSMSTIQIILNGNKKAIEPNTTITGLLNELNIKSKMFVVEKNMEIIQQRNYTETLKDGDELEIVGFFGGG